MVDENINRVHVELTVVITPYDMSGKNVGSEPLTIHRTYYGRSLARIIHLIESMEGDSDVRRQRLSSTG